MWLQNILTISYHLFFWVDFEIEVRWVCGGNSRSTAVQSPRPLLRCFAVLLSSWSSYQNFSGWSEIAGNNRCDFLSSARSDREFISCFWESCVFEYWKKEKRLVFQWKKSGKNGRAIENFKGIIVFLFYYTCPTFSR